jgi:hypothetical protein
MTDFFGDCVNCYNTTVEVPPFIDEWGLLDRCLYTSCDVPSVSNLSQILEIVSYVGGPVATSHTFSNYQYHSKLICAARKSSEPPPFCITLWIIGKVKQFLIATDAFCQVHATQLGGTLNLSSTMNMWLDILYLNMYTFFRHPVFISMFLSNRKLFVLLALVSSQITWTAA